MYGWTFGKVYGVTFESSCHAGDMVGFSHLIQASDPPTMSRRSRYVGNGYTEVVGHGETERPGEAPAA